ncbi:MAG TPA: alpha/beta hydrolase [Chitinophagaceae bacterium]|nr:alpha/beta hydrolase [Chitinophagaceae bacterium]
MKRILVMFSLIVSIMTTSIAQTNNQNNNSLNTTIMNFKNVKKQSINVGGIQFYYRILGENNPGLPIIFLNHLSATMDDCDPKIMDGLAAEHPIICFDNRGVGSTGETTPKTVSAMAVDAIAFIKALGYQKVDLLGFSLGGFITQEIMLREPQLVRKAILAGTGPAGGEKISKMSRVVFTDVFKGIFTFRNEKFYLFFNGNANGRKAAKSYLGRLNENKENRGKKIKMKHLLCQLDAIKAWGLQAPQDLSVITHPVLIVNGDSDKMVPIINSYELKKRIKNSDLIVYKDAGHGGIFQYNEEFVKSALNFFEQ